MLAGWRAAGGVMTLTPFSAFAFTFFLAFSFSTFGGVLFAKFFNLFLKNKINPVIGAAGVSAVPMAARVVNRVGLETDHHNFLLMHAMGPNVAGVLGSAVAAGLLLALLGGGV